MVLFYKGVGSSSDFAPRSGKQETNARVGTIFTVMIQYTNSIGTTSMFFFSWSSFLFIANNVFTCFKINLPRRKDFIGLSMFDGNYICSFVMTTGPCPTHIVQITLPALCARTHILAFTTGSKSGRTWQFTWNDIGSVQKYNV